MKLEISDEDGMIALVNAEKYLTFIAPNWTLDQVMTRFVEQMKQQNLIIWQTNNFGGGYWELEVLDKPSPQKAYSEFKKTIRVTEGKLYLVNYTDLTMAAQFEKEKIPSKVHAEKFILLENGLYEVTIRRMFNPKEDINEDVIAFELIAHKTTQGDESVTEKVFWYTF